MCGIDNFFFSIWTWINYLNYYWNWKGFPGWGKKRHLEWAAAAVHSFMALFLLHGSRQYMSKPSPDGGSPEGLIFVPHKKVKKNNHETVTFGKKKKGALQKVLSSVGYGVKAGIYSNSGQEKLKIREGNACSSLLRTQHGKGTRKADNIYDPCRIKVLSQSTFTLWMKEIKSSQMYTMLCLFFIPFPRGAVWGVSTCNGGIKLRSMRIFLCFLPQKRTVGHQVGSSSTDKLPGIHT